MSRGRVARRLAGVAGAVFILLGIVEVTVRIVSPETVEADALAFWFLSLCGGGALVLLGSFVVTRPAWASFVLVAAGCLAGALATMWTVVLPVLALTVLVQAVPRRAQGIDGTTA
jgi:hypothetical protein